MFSTPLSIEVLPHQQEHIKKIEEALYDKVYGVIDTSVMGNGKTYTTTKIAYDLNLPIVVICPTRIASVWEGMKRFGAKIISIHSYGVLSKASKSFPYLDKVNKTYVPTQQWLDLVNKGIMLVLDESHRVKNKDSLQTEAACQLIYPITLGTKSRYMFLSATPYDSEKFITSSFRTLGYTTARILSDLDKITKIRDNTGIIDVVRNAQRLDPEATDDVLDDFPSINDNLTSSTANSLANELFIRVYKKHIIYSMVSPKLEKDVGTLYSNMTELEYARYKLAVRNLSEVVLFNEDTGEVGTNSGKDRLARLSIAMRDIEHVKVGIFAREAARILNDNPNAKVVIAVTFNTTMPMLLERLAALVDNRALIINGEPQNKRYTDDIIKVFQEPNNTFRLLIVNIASGAEGISLHDLDGRFPRTMLLSPSYSILKLHQASGRIIRVGAKSLGTVRMLYGKYCMDPDIDVKEQRIADALTRKTKVMASILDQAVKDGIKFPGEYIPIIEPPKEINLQTEYYNLDKGLNLLDLQQINSCLEGTLVCISQNGDNPPKLYNVGQPIQREQITFEEGIDYGSYEEDYEEE